MLQGPAIARIIRVLQQKIIRRMIAVTVGGNDLQLEGVPNLTTRLPLKRKLMRIITKLFNKLQFASVFVFSIYILCESVTADHALPLVPAGMIRQTVSHFIVNIAYHHTASKQDGSLDRKLKSTHSTA